MMLAEVGQIREQSSNIEFLVDSGAAWLWNVKLGSSQGGTFRLRQARQLNLRYDGSEILAN